MKTDLNILDLEITVEGKWIKGEKGDGYLQPDVKDRFEVTHVWYKNKNIMPFLLEIDYDLDILAQEVEENI